MKSLPFSGKICILSSTGNTMPLAYSTGPFQYCKFSTERADGSGICVPHIKSGEVSIYLVRINYQLSKLAFFQYSIALL